MGDYNNVARECSLSQLRPELMAAMRAHIEKYALGNLETQAMICCETTSEKKKKGLLGSLPGWCGRAVGLNMAPSSPGRA